MRVLTRVRSRRGRVILTAAVVTSIAASAFAATPASAGMSPASAATLAQQTADQKDAIFWDNSVPTAIPPIDDPEVEGTADIQFTIEMMPTNIGTPMGGRVPISVDGKILYMYGPNWSTGTSTRINANTDVISTTSNTSVIQRNQNEMRSLTVVENPSAPTSYTYTLGSSTYRFQQVPGEPVNIVEYMTGKVLGTVGDAWAQDANGAAVASSFTVNPMGDLVQTVNHVGAAYPIVAFSKISYGWYVYSRSGRNENQKLGPTVTYLKVVNSLCGFIPITWISVACSAGAGIYFNSMADTIKYAIDNRRCLELRFVYMGPIVGWRTFNGPSPSCWD